ncbi:MAG: AAA family ATPase [Desulfobacterales bacterium]|nr:AAA family ATPase [Desulfobacterales bacterium]
MALYSEKLKHPKWQKKRLEIFQRDNWQCVQCGDSDTELSVHHTVYRRGVNPWEYDGNELITLCVNCHENAHGVIDSFHVGNLLHAAFKRVEEPFFGNLTGVPSGFRFIDRKLGGFQNSELIVIAGRPGMGKTALALTIAWHITVEAGIPAALFSLESDDFQISTRILCAQAGLDPVRLKRGHINREDWRRMTNVLGILQDAPLFIDTSNGLSLGTIERRIRKIRSEKNLGIAIIDNLKMMGNTRSDDREILRRMKETAKETGIPIILLSQLDGQMEERTDKRPRLYDLRGTDILSIADVVLFLYRDEVYNRAPENPLLGKAEIEIAKNRHGPVGRSVLGFTEQYGLFNELKRFPREET